MMPSFKWNRTPKFYINLLRRKDRAIKVEEEFSKHGLIVLPWEAQDSLELVVPFDSPKRNECNAAGILACAISHVSLIRYARDNEFKYVVIFEDDVLLSDNFASKIKYIESIKEDWDLFYLGCHHYESTATSHDEIYQVSVAAGTYGYIMKNTLFDFVVENWRYRYGWDEFLDYEILKRFKALAILPPIVTTYPNFSDVAGHYVNYKL